MDAPASIAEYLRLHGNALSEKVLRQFPPLHNPQDEPWPAMARLKRRPFPAQALAIMGIVKRWEQATCAAAVAECGTGKTLISLGSIFTHAGGHPFTSLAMVPPQLVEKWARECFSTLPGVRVFVIDGVRNGVGSNGFTGVNEVWFRNGRIVREGLRTTLSDMRLAKAYRSARARAGTGKCAEHIRGLPRAGEAGVLLAAHLQFGGVRAVPRKHRQSGHWQAGHSR